MTSIGWIGKKTAVKRENGRRGVVRVHSNPKYHALNSSGEHASQAKMEGGKLEKRQGEREVSKEGGEEGGVKEGKEE